MQYLFLPQAQVNQTNPLFSCKLWNTIYREIIIIMTIMMKTIKKRLNLYTKYIFMGWGPVYFLNLHLFSLQVTCNTTYITPWLRKANCPFWLLVQDQCSMPTNNRQPKSMYVLSENNIPFQRGFFLKKIFCQGTGEDDFNFIII